jgi:hypothetical protein
MAAIQLEKHVILVGLRVVMEAIRRVRRKTNQVAMDCTGLDFGIVLGKPVDCLLPRERLPCLQCKRVSHILHEEPYWFGVDRHSEFVLAWST